MLFARPKAISDNSLFKDRSRYDPLNFANLRARTFQFHQRRRHLADRRRWPQIFGFGRWHCRECAGPCASEPCCGPNRASAKPLACVEPIYYPHEIGSFPKEWKLSIRQPIANTVESLTVNPGFIAFTKGLRAFVYLKLLHPLDVFLTHIPWWYTMGVFTLIGYFTVGLRFAFTTALLLLFIGACGIWTHSMITLSSVLVSVALCFAVGVPLGIIASYNERFKNIQNVVLDAMQTLPYFCYLIPVLMFFGGGIVSAVLATVIYSIPPIIRLTTLGLTQVSVSYSEVSRSFGGTLLQTLGKVKFPLAVPSLVIGFNQTVILAFAMQIVTPLIGGKGLGLEVFNGLARSDTGRGLAAGIAIVLLAIIIDRITLAYTKKQRIALGLIKE